MGDGEGDRDTTTMRQPECVPESKGPKVDRLLDSVKKAIMFVMGSCLLLLAAARNSFHGHIHSLWGATGSFWQSCWDHMYKEWFHEDDLAFGWLGSFLVTLIIFWLANVFFLVVDITGTPGLVLKYKIQSDEKVPWPKLKKALWLVSYNQIVMGLPICMCSFYLMKWRGNSLSGELPTFLWVMFEILVFSFVLEIMFYYSHRLLHHPRLYKHIHKIHHKWTAPTGILSLYAHPLEHLVSNIMPTMMGPILMGSHLAIATQGKVRGNAMATHIVLLFMIWNMLCSGTAGMSNFQRNCKTCLSFFNGHCTSCKWGYYGDKCDMRCPPLCPDCKMTDGKCYTCPSGFHGDLCTVRCPSNCANCASNCTSCISGFHGDNCTRRCPSNCASCTSNTQCLTCKPGFHGNTCTESCPSGCVTCTDETHCNSCKSGRYGDECKLPCPINCVNCTRDTLCLACKPGYHGNTCTESCPSGCVTCTDETHCNLCKSGYYGDECIGICPVNCANCISDTECGECAPGFHGNTCTERCPLNCTTCYDTVIGVRCRGCEPGSYGAVCEKQCPRNCIRCFENHRFLACLECRAGYRGMRCNIRKKSL